MQNNVTVSTFYHFAPLNGLPELKNILLTCMKESGIKGTITLAPEGVNATIAGSKQAVSHLLGMIRNIKGFEGVQDRISYYITEPFKRSKVKIKRELISIGAPAHPSVCVGIHVPPNEWNALISRDDVITIDTRNDYEYAIGHFKGAINPATRNFKEMVAFTELELDPEKHPVVAMYCTGGIRCEKYSSYLLTQGFKQVYHLRGGILAYLESIPQSESLWWGDCYVFDERIAVRHGLIRNADVSSCDGCGRLLYSADRAHPSYIEKQQCPHCVGKKGQG